MPSPFDQLEQLSRALPEGGEMRLPALPLAHYPITDPALAAAVLTLGIPPREPEPFTHAATIDAKGNEAGRKRMIWWVGAKSPGPDESAHKTEVTLGFWEHRQRFEAEHPLHPLVAMRAALDARNAWIRAMNTRGMLPTEPGPAPAYATDSLHGASVLVACGYSARAFSGRAFYVDAARSGVPAEKLLRTAAIEEGATPAQWMAMYLRNFSHLVKIMKDRSILVQQNFGSQTMILTADSTTKTRDQFFNARRFLP